MHTSEDAAWDIEDTIGDIEDVIGDMTIQKKRLGRVAEMLLAVTQK